MYSHNPQNINKKKVQTHYGFCLSNMNRTFYHIALYYRYTYGTCIQ